MTKYELAYPVNKPYTNLSGKTLTAGIEQWLFPVIKNAELFDAIDKAKTKGQFLLCGSNIADGVKPTTTMIGLVPRTIRKDKVERYDKFLLNSSILASTAGVLIRQGVPEENLPSHHYRRIDFWLDGALYHSAQIDSRQAAKLTEILVKFFSTGMIDGALEHQQQQAIRKKVLAHYGGNEQAAEMAMKIYAEKDKDGNRDVASMDLAAKAIVDGAEDTIKPEA